MKGNTLSPEKYVVLDTNVLVGYYIPDAIAEPARSNIRIFLESCRTGKQPDWYLLIPNLVIAETFSTFAKYCFATWNPHIKKSLPKGLDTRRYKNVRKRFHEHIHNGLFFHQVELNRYHVLAIDLIAPIDHYFQHYKGKKNKSPMQTADMLILAMGIHLNHQLGKDRFSIITADRRMSAICEKARAGINDNTAEKLGIREKAEELGYGYSPDIYPRVINLHVKDKKLLKEAFGNWPLEVANKSTTGINKPF